jgi:methylphosphotriester-DNA--protein-cysteine methyltransferase
VYLLDYLMRLRQEKTRGLLLNMGEVNVTRMVAFTDGYRACQRANGINDEEYGLFRDWLRDVKQEFPTEGWAAKYLRDCDGDHERAIRKYLDFVAEFVASREKERQQT